MNDELPSPDRLDALLDEARGSLSEAAFAKKIGVSQHCLWWARRRGGRVSPRLAVLIERGSGGRVSRLTLRPDVFAGAGE